VSQVGSTPTSFRHLSCLVSAVCGYQQKGAL